MPTMKRRPRCLHCGTAAARTSRLYCRSCDNSRRLSESRKRADAWLADVAVDRTPIQRYLDADWHPPLTAEAEADLAHQALAGDLAAQHELVLRNLRLIMMKVKGSADRRQAALEVAVRAAAEYDPDALYGRKRQRIRFTTFVGRQAHWAALAHDADRRRQPLPMDPNPEPADDDAPRLDLNTLAAEQAADRAEAAAEAAESAARRAEAAAAALDRLTPNERRVMVCWAAEPGRHAADVARELGMAEHQVYGYRRRAKARLREAAGDHRALAA